MDEDSGKRKKRRHCPNPDSLKFDKQGLLAEVKDLPENSKVCFIATIIILIIIFINASV